MVYLGDWMANAIRVGDDRDLEMEKVDSYLFLCKRF